MSDPDVMSDPGSARTIICVHGLNRGATTSIRLPQHWPTTATGWSAPISLAAPQRPPARPDDYALPQYIADGTMLMCAWACLSFAAWRQHKQNLRMRNGAAGTYAQADFSG